VADVELAVEVIGFVLKSTGQQIIAGLFEDLPGQILGADGDHFGAIYVFAELWDAEAAFALRVAAFLVDNFGINEDYFRVGVLLEGDVHDGDAARDADLRRRQAHTASGIHRLEHVIDEQFQFSVKDRNFLGRLLEDRISELYDGIDHFSGNQ